MVRKEKNHQASGAKGSVPGVPEPFADPVVIPITGELDLHTFSPRELAPLLEDYLQACNDQGLTQVRLIHGKGTGQLKASVRRLLAQNPLVLYYTDADHTAGGWGTTVVTLKPGG
ncbi:MAG: Smr/MutS family protein [Desulfobacca sp.]|uniref:Smr/MutS family protein n=1 Tax=Desulfobacca sp. TaxID=2067990 RepID=UPI00404B1C34